MSGADRFVQDTRNALAVLCGAGAAGARTEAPRTWKALSARAIALGLPDLAERCARVAEELEARGALAFEASPPLADSVLAVFDRVEALSSTLMMWSAEAQMTEPSSLQGNN